ncbi:MAG: peptidoglycan-associated lipoprotein Pal [Pseudomonadota bacterium]
MKAPLSVAFALMLALAACSNTDDASLDPSTAAGVNSATGGGVSAGNLPPPNTVAYFNTVIGDRVFFETDSTTLTATGQNVLTQQADWLRANIGSTATIEGHADERGTREYNLALGARRADAVRAFLVAQGIDGGRLDTVTFGKERPVSLCSNESCWSENRRGVTVIAGGPVS